MFSAGIGIGLFFFGVAEPVSHYEPCGANPPAGQGSQCYGNRYAQLQDDERAQWAINMSFFHWGIHAWASYCIVGLLLGIMVYRKCAPSGHVMRQRRLAACLIDCMSALVTMCCQ